MKGSSPSRTAIALALMLASLAGLFAWGYLFEVFGKPIRFNWRFIGFVGWFLLGGFGIGMLDGWRRGLTIAGQVALLFGAAFTLGWLLGNYD